MSQMRSRTSFGMSTYVSVVISPATTTRPVVMSVSHATRPDGSSRSTQSRTESEIWSAILSGWPSVTDSEVKVKERLDMRARLADAYERLIARLPVRPVSEGENRSDAGQTGRRRYPSEGEERQQILHVAVEEAGRLAAHSRLLRRLDELRIAR